VPGGVALGGIAVNGQHIYWNSYNGNLTSAMGRADLDGSNVDLAFITGNADMLGIELDSQYVYWSDYVNYDRQGAGTIGRALLDGTGVDHTFITDVGHGYFMTVG